MTYSCKHPRDNTTEVAPGVRWCVVCGAIEQCGTWLVPKERMQRHLRRLMLDLQAAEDGSVCELTQDARHKAMLRNLGRRDYLRIENDRVYLTERGKKWRPEDDPL